MKVTLPKDYKRMFTIHQVEVAKKVIKSEKEDEFTAEEYAKLLVNHIITRQGLNDGVQRVFEVTAGITTARGWDKYFEGSEDIDIYIECYVRTWDGVVYATAMLSDIWRIGGEETIPYHYEYYTKTAYTK